jgi:hypothetical protein
VLTMAVGLNPPVSAVYRSAKQTTTAQGVEIKPGQRVLVSIEQANMDVRVALILSQHIWSDVPIHSQKQWALSRRRRLTIAPRKRLAYIASAAMVF